MAQVDVYKYESLKHLLSELSQSPIGLGRRKWSLRLWAKKLGYKSPRSVGMVFKGHRLPSLLMLHRISEVLKLSPEEREYFISLLTLEKIHSNSPEEFALKMSLHQRSPWIKDDVELTTEEMSNFTDWQNVVIRQLAKSNVRTADPEKIKARLKHKVSVEEIEASIRCLKKAGFLDENSQHRLTTKGGSLKSSQDIPSADLRKHHKQMMTRAIESVEEVPVHEREMNSATFVFDKKRLSEAKEMIRTFRDRFEKQFATEDAKDVYQFNIQFFPHTADTSYEK